MSGASLAGKRVVISSYTHIKNGTYTKLGGPALALKDFLKNRAQKLLCVWQPLPISDTLCGVAEIYEKSESPLKIWKFPVINWPFGRQKEISFIYIVLKLRDILCTIYFVLRSRQRFDLFIGVEALNVIVGIFLRKIRIVKKVLYYSLDYGEVRFKNRILNFIFHALDKFAVYHADCVWNLSPAMAEAREKRGILRGENAPQITVPIGTDFERINRLSVESIDRTCVVYLGVLSEKQGVPLIFEALRDIVRKVPTAKLVIIGVGSLEGQLKSVTKGEGFEGKVEFFGLLEDDRKIEKLLARCSIGLAPYFPDPNSTKKFTDVTKPKMYLACGLPVVITKVPPIAKEIEENGAGLVINYDRKELTEAVVKLLTDEKLFKLCRENAIELASKYAWNDIFTKAFRETMEKAGGDTKEFACMADSGE
ncbi:MAG: glycosyltransferase [Actinomycetota bacterium]|nr:glycosyltransferase [Actinomycetota bacterium]